MVYGTLNGTIRIKVGDHFFKTITITHMTGWAADTYTNYCVALCPSPYYVVQGSGPFSPVKPDVVLTAQTRFLRQPSSVAVSVFDPTAGTPFLSVAHILSAAGATPFVRSNSNLTSARVNTPGGVLSGSLGFKSSSGLRTSAYGRCTGGHPHETSRYAMVTAGRITAIFDSIGKFSLAGTMNRPLPRRGPAPIFLSRVS